MELNVVAPSPPLNIASPEPGVALGDDVVITLRTGSKVVGAIVRFASDSNYIKVMVKGEDAARKYFLDEVRIINFPKQRQWTAAKLGDDIGVQLPPEKLDFMLVFEDGSKLEGDTLGFKTDRAGLHLFPAVGTERFIYAYVNPKAVKNHRIGGFLGEILIKDKVVTGSAVAEILAEQDEQRKMPLGEYLMFKAVVSSETLEQALRHQKTMPNMRLGEILISEGLITEEQLNEALQEQSTNRKRPLGEILVERGLVTRDEIQRGLAKKLGIPFVDLKVFQVSPDVVAKLTEELANKHKVIPVMMHEGKLVVALENPMDWEAVDALKFHTSLQIEAVMATAGDLRHALNFYYKASELSGASIQDIAGDHAGYVDDEASAQPQDEAMADNLVVKLINKIIVDAYNQNVSDIHIEPYPGNHKTIIRFRKDGTLVTYVELPAQYKNALVARIKVMAQLDISERRKPQDGKIDFKKFGPLNIELRIATVPTAGGLEDVVMRILAAGEPVPLEKLGLSRRNEDQIRQLVTKPYGLFLVCGPTGSGKTTTLHSILGHINTTDRKIWTAEDPVEITQKGLRQVQVNAKIGMSFAAVMRSFLRADPDVIMVGEMRDKETTSTGIEASLTGHMVFSTLHTNSAPESVVRLLDMGMDPFNFADALIGIIAQRLAKRLCAKCCQAYEPDAKEIDDLLKEYCRDMPENTDAMRQQVLEEWRGAFASSQGHFSLNRAVGCDACDKTGYRGRIGIHELLVASEQVKKFIIEERPVAELTKLAISEGMRTLKQDGIEKVIAGFTDISRVRAVCSK